MFEPTVYNPEKEVRRLPHAGNVVKGDGGHQKAPHGGRSLCSSPFLVVTVLCSGDAGQLFQWTATPLRGKLAVVVRPQWNQYENTRRKPLRNL